MFSYQSANGISLFKFYKKKRGSYKLPSNRKRADITFIEQTKNTLVSLLQHEGLCKFNDVSQEFSLAVAFIYILSISALILSSLEVNMLISRLIKSSFR